MLFLITSTPKLHFTVLYDLHIESAEAITKSSTRIVSGKIKHWNGKDSTSIVTTQAAVFGSDWNDKLAYRKSNWTIKQVSLCIWSHLDENMIVKGSNWGTLCIPFYNTCCEIKVDTVKASWCPCVKRKLMRCWCVVNKTTIFLEKEAKSHHVKRKWMWRWCVTA